MSSRGIGAGGVFQIAIMILAVIATGIDWLVEGHISHGFLWWLLSVYVGLILAGFHERLDDIRDTTNEIRKQNEKILAKLDDLERTVRNIGQ